MLAISPPLHLHSRMQSANSPPLATLVLPGSQTANLLFRLTSVSFGPSSRTSINLTKTESRPARGSIPKRLWNSQPPSSHPRFCRSRAPRATAPSVLLPPSPKPNGQVNHRQTQTRPLAYSRSVQDGWPINSQWDDRIRTFPFSRPGTHQFHLRTRVCPLVGLPACPPSIMCQHMRHFHMRILLR